VALVAEGTSLIRALAETRADARRQGCSIRAYLKGSTDPTVKTVLFEDGAAVTGVLVAVAGILAHQLTGRRVWEASASIVIGCGLAYVAFRLGSTSKQLIVGRPASPAERTAIRESVFSHPAVERVTDLRTVHIGPASLFVCLRVAFRGGLGSEAIADATTEIERDLRRVVPDISDVYLDSGRTDG
jgi:divalent metal cation (Fe/Co/Zn/Cd) transporter